MHTHVPDEMAHVRDELAHALLAAHVCRPPTWRGGERRGRAEGWGGVVGVSEGREEGAGGQGRAGGVFGQGGWRGQEGRGGEGGMAPLMWQMKGRQVGRAGG